MQKNSMAKQDYGTIAFVIVCWNNKDLLKECIDSIYSQTHSSIKVILVDNGSKDDSVAYTRKIFPGVQVIEAGANFGFAKGNNIGIAAALSDPQVTYVALLNTDARLAPSWTEDIVMFAAKKPKGACFQGTTLDYYNHKVIDSTHIYVARNAQATQGNWREPYTIELGPRKVFGVNAAACLISRDFIMAQPFGNQLFDEAMFMYLEDVDLAARATMMGWDNYLVPRARAYHMGSASSGKNPGYSLYMTFRNNSGMILKNFPIRTMLKLFWIMPRSDFDTIRHLRTARNKAASWRVIKGRLLGILLSPRYILKRRKLLRVRNIDEEYLWQLMKSGW